MSPLLIKISRDFATLFTTINPIATLALFAGLTASLSRADRHWTALRACIYATIILVVAMTLPAAIATPSMIVAQMQARSGLQRQSGRLSESSMTAAIDNAAL